MREDNVTIDAETVSDLISELQSFAAMKSRAKKTEVGRIATNATTSPLIAKLEGLLNK